MLEVINRINTHGFKAYLVGGAIRDMFLKQENQDLDIFTTAPLDVVKTLFKDAKIIDVEKGTLILIYKGTHYEISSFQKGHTTLLEDAKRRDFTMNSLYYDGKVHDFVGGIEDIEHRRIRMNDESVMVEDPIRILRALRFVSTLRFRLEHKTERAIFKHKHLLNTVAKERILKEFKGILLGTDVSYVMHHYVDILAIIFPELKIMEHFNQHNPHHAYDLLTHTIKVMEHTPEDETLRLAAFFHDFGKVETFFVDKEGVGHFYGHEKVSAKLASKYLTFLQEDKKIRSEVIELVSLHGYPTQTTLKGIRRLNLKLEHTTFKNLLSLKKADRLGKGTDKDLDDLDLMAKIFCDLKETSKLLSLKTLKLKGSDLLKLGIQEGPIIGRILQDCLLKCVDETLENDKDVLLDYVYYAYLVE